MQLASILPETIIIRRVSSTKSVNSDIKSLDHADYLLIQILLDEKAPKL